MKIVLALLLAAVSACANAAEPDPIAPDAGMTGQGGGGADDPEEQSEDKTCAAGTHTCGTACVADQANSPDVGCTFGCGEACPAPANGSATCSAGSVCEIECNPGYSQENGACVAFSCSSVGYSCGNYTDDAGTTFSCGTCFGSTTCGSDHECNVAADSFEPNNSSSTAKDLGSFNDADNASRWVERLTIDDTSDYDWFKFRVVDGFDFNNPDVRVSLGNRGTQLGWLASSHDLTVWFKCDGSDEGTNMDCGEWYTTEKTNNASGALGKGCQTYGTYVVWAEFEPNCSGTNESGTVYVRVKKNFAPRGDSYDLYVEAK